MKPYIFFLVSSLFSLAAFCQSADESKVRQVIQKMEDSYNAHDYSFSGKYDVLSPHAVLINPIGMYWKNRTEIIEGTKEIGEIRLKYETVKYKIKSVRFLAPAVALVIIHAFGKVELDYNWPDGSKGGSKGDTTEGMYTITLVKEGNEWKITSMQITHVEAVAQKINPVKDN